MKATILLILVLAVGACTEEVSPQEAITPSDESRGMIDIENVRTYADLRFYLDQRYGEVEELLVEAVISSGVDTTVPYRYRLEGGRELTVPIVFTASSERIVDPDFDLESALDQAADSGTLPMMEYVEEMWRLAANGEKQGVLFFIAVYALVVCLYSFVRQLLIRQWPVTTGLLRSASVEKWGGTERTLSDQEYRVDALYDYQVAGKNFQGTRVSPWIVVVSHNARFLLRKQLGGIKRNEDGTSDVLYNPKKPEKSYLVKPSLFGMGITLAIAILPLVFYFLEYAQAWEWAHTRHRKRHWFRLH